MFKNAKNKICLTVKTFDREKIQSRGYFVFTLKKQGADEHIVMVLFKGQFNRRMYTIDVVGLMCVHCFPTNTPLISLKFLQKRLRIIFPHKQSTQYAHAKKNPKPRKNGWSYTEGLLFFKQQIKLEILSQFSSNDGEIEARAKKVHSICTYNKRMLFYYQRKQKRKLVVVMNV